LARRRLKVEPWPSGYEALSYAERGQLVHAMMASFWLDVRSHAALMALDASSLAARVEQAAIAARESVPPGRWKLLPPVVAAAEVARIAQIGREWVEDFERPRAPYEVVGVEQAIELTLADLTFRLKLDRIDKLADGTTAIIDYKTGAVDAPKTWFARRPRSPQLGLYALALRPSTEVTAVAYARLKAGDIEVLGLAKDRDQWTALTAADALNDPAGWGAIEAWWATRLPQIAAEFRDGVASVTPRDAPACCRACRLQALCRIEESVPGTQEGAT
jgi:RecB family exonuclease